jgi:hypothetical protein
MPKNNRFAHQNYEANRPSSLWHLLRAAVATADSFQDDTRLTNAGLRFRAAGIGGIYLVHGTFAGDDALGLIRTASIAFPELAQRARRLHKQTSDSLFQDAGNYTEPFADQFQQAVGIPVHLVRWSSENHHVARAHAAVCLIDRLWRSEPSGGDRLLLWGHSHGGNVFALMTNLLVADRSSRRRFFRACRSFYLGGSRDDAEFSAWRRVQELLRRGEGPSLAARLDLVTFGTPIRYGWDSGGYTRLLHFVHHRPRPGLPPQQTGLPSSLDDVSSAADGDYIQHWGIAGTNLTPNVFAWRTWLAELRLGRLVQAGQRRRDLLQRLKAGVRVPEEGETLLVDYSDSIEPFPRNFLGHAVYTRRRWLPFHAQEVANRFYGEHSHE